MMLVETAPLAEDLEKGLGEVLPMIKGIDPWMRLRTGVCGHASYALAKHLKEGGHDAELISSQPGLIINPYLEHTMVLVDGHTIIDPTYTQFLEYAGLTPGHVFFGGRNDYPDDKIASFEIGKAEKIVSQLTLLARYIMDHFEPSNDMLHDTVMLRGLDDDEIEAIYAKIWNPDHFVDFEPSEFIHEKGSILAEFIVPEHVKLIA